MRGDILGLERRRRWSDEEKLGIALSVGVEGATVTDMRKGIEGWQPWRRISCARSRQAGRCLRSAVGEGDRLKLLYWDGQGFCLYYTVLERGRFPWPSSKDGTARLTSAQMAMLWEGIDWRRPDWGAPPARVG